jgi:hypothetical protein
MGERVMGGGGEVGSAKGNPRYLTPHLPECWAWDCTAQNGTSTPDAEML